MRIIKDNKSKIVLVCFVVGFLKFGIVFDIVLILVSVVYLFVNVFSNKIKVIGCVG